MLGLLGLGAAAILWFGVRGRVGGLGGWDRLADSYRVADLPPGERFRSATASMGDGPVRVQYRNVLNVVMSPSGFGVSIQSVFGKAPSIFIPWTHVESVTASRVMFADTALIKVHGAYPAIFLYGGAGATALRAYGQSKRVL
jgi:hypothetical protein